MLATRRLPLAAIKNVYPSRVIWFSRFKSVPILESNVMRCITAPSFAAAYSKDIKTAETPLNSNNPSQASASTFKDVSSTSTFAPKSSPLPSAPNTTDPIKNQNNESSAGSLSDAGIKLPSKDQVENFAFKTLVYFSDFVYYAFRLCLKLFQTHVVNNITVQQYWKQLLKRMEDARKDIKTK